MAKDKIKELKKIREAFKASQAQFGEVFLGGISKSQIYYYEHGLTKIPENVMMLARQWKKILDTMNGKNDEKI